MENSFKKRLVYLQQVEKELTEWSNSSEFECSEACLQSMKHIYKVLRCMIYQAEATRIERKKQRGKLTPKEAVHLKAMARKRYL